MNAFLIAALVISIALLSIAWLRILRAWREAYVRAYMFPPGLFDRLVKKRPALALKDQQLIARALRQFFLAYLKGGRRFVAMPSQVVDDLWHEFILYTQHYKQFCSRAFGRFMHHTPAVALGPDRNANVGLRRVWWNACLEENINPRRPTRLPLLFALDEKLQIADGFRYTVDCTALREKETGGNPRVAIYCGGDFCNPGSDGTLSGYGDTGAGGAGFFGFGHHHGAGDHGHGGGHGCSGGHGGGCSGGCSGGCGSS
jgi:hypothetical protein